MLNTAMLCRCHSTNDETETNRRPEIATTISDHSSILSQPHRGNATAEAVHDFRNILSIVSMLSELARTDLEDASPVGAMMRQIQAACIDGKNLCDQMMEDFGSASPNGERANLPNLITSMSPLLRTFVPTGSELRFNLAEKPTFATASSSAIRQVVINLVKNAAEALCDEPGTITVSTGLIEFDALGTAESMRQGSTSTETCSYISVLDTGCGMDDATKLRLFEDHFTTKRDGHGLGMASIRRIVRRCGGSLRVESHVGSGTEVRVLFAPSLHRRFEH